MIWTYGSSDRPGVDRPWVGRLRVYVPSRPEMNVSDFLPVGELQTIGRAELRVVLRALNEVTTLRPASIMCDRKHIVDGCNGQAMKWKRNEWRTTSGPVKHADLWKQILIVLEVYATHVTVHHVSSHAELAKNQVVDALAGEGRMRSPLWAANRMLLNFASTTPAGDSDVQLLSARALTPSPRSREHNDFVPWSPESVILMSEGGSPHGTPKLATTTPVRHIVPLLYQEDAPSPRMSLGFTDFDV